MKKTPIVHTDLRHFYIVDLRSASGIELENESLVEVTVLIEGLPLPIKPPDAIKENYQNHYFIKR